MGRGPEPILGIGEIAFRLAKLAHGDARERVLEVDREKLPQRVAGSERLAAPLLMLHAVEQRFGWADAFGTIERDGLFRHVCVCVDLPLCAAVSQDM